MVTFLKRSATSPLENEYVQKRQYRQKTNSESESEMSQSLFDTQPPPQEEHVQDQSSGECDQVEIQSGGNVSD